MKRKFERQFKIDELQKTHTNEPQVILYYFFLDYLFV